MVLFFDGKTSKISVVFAGKLADMAIQSPLRRGICCYKEYGDLGTNLLGTVSIPSSSGHLLLLQLPKGTGKIPRFQSPLRRGICCYILSSP